MPRAVWIALIASACTIAEDDFAARASDAICDRAEECTEVFETEDERANCEAFWGGAAELLLDLGDLAGSNYDPAAGAACVRDIRAASCAEFNDFEIDCDLFEDDAAE